ncbi:MAG: AI-2E family transporter, partial [Bacteroidia bacterium]
MSIYNPSQRKNIILGLVYLLGIFLFYSMLGIFTALLGAVVMFTLFRPFYIYLIKKKKLNKSFSAAIIIVVSFLIIVIPMFILSWLIINKLINFQQNPAMLSTLIDKLSKLIGTSVDKTVLIRNGVSNISQWALGQFSSFVNSAFRIFINLMVLYFSLFYMLVSYEAFEHTVLKYLPFKENNSLRFGTELKNITYSNIFGQGLIAAAQGLVVGTGFLIFRIPDPLFWGVISFFVCFLPVVGAPIIIVPAGLIEMANGNTVAGVGIIIWGMVLVIVADNFLRFYISKKIADTHPLITLIGVIIGVPFFGIIGIVIGPLL